MALHSDSSSPSTLSSSAPVKLAIWPHVGFPQVYSMMSNGENMAP